MLDVSSTFNNGQDNNPVIAGRHPLGSSVTNNRLSAMGKTYVSNLGAIIENAFDILTDRETMTSSNLQNTTESL